MSEVNLRGAVMIAALVSIGPGCFDKQFGDELGETGETGASGSGSPQSGPPQSESSEPGPSESGSDESDPTDGEDESTGGDDSSDTGAPPPDLDDGSGCAPPAIDPRRSLIETNPAALAGITMPAILARAAQSGDLVEDPEFTYTRLIDSFAPVEAAALPGGSHCDDSLVDGVASLNGFPIQCPRAEAGLLGQLDDWVAIAAVNRFDLAAGDGSDCGEQRLILAHVGEPRMFVIFEARIPNPEPLCGLASCTAVVEFWLGLSELADPAARHEQLLLAFLDGHPALTEAGFEPFMAGVNLTFGAGQIRTNSFVDDPWTLREFRLVADGTRLGAVAVPVRNNGFGPLWNDLDPAPQGPACRQSILAALDGLLVDDVAAMGLAVDPSCHAGESRDDGDGDYAGALAAGSGAFEAALAEQLAALGSDLSPAELANRASFASNCMGCHQSAIGLPLGHGLFGPSSLGFVHVDEFTQEPCGGGSCFAISKALRDQFLPARQLVIEQFWAEHGCTPGCADPGPGAVGSALAGPAITGLPDAGEGVAALLARERAALDEVAAPTLGGRPRGSH